jgi:CRISPR-associated endonuclease/helicase Cas3
MNELLAKDKVHGRDGRVETLFEHTQAVIDAVRQVVANLPKGVFDEATVERDLVLCAAFHDVGKAATGFQEVLIGERETWDGKRHEVLSTAFAANCDTISEEMRLAILTHHRTLPDHEDKGAVPVNQTPDDDDPPRPWREMVQEWSANRDAFRVFWLKLCALIGRDDLASLANSALTSLGLRRAWLDRSTHSPTGQLKSIPFDQRQRAALYRGLLVTADHMASGHTMPQAFPTLSAALVYDGTLRGFQEKCKAIRHSAILRAPTGSGKTESSLLWMQSNWRKNSRVFYVLPYTASINAMHRRLQAIFGNSVVNVLHSKASTYLYNQLAHQESQLALERQKIAVNLATLSKEMYFPIRVCTPHQIMRYALHGKGWEQMLGEFPQACFIFDEVHAYNPALTGLILGVAKMANRFDARMLFTTATMPMFLQKLIQKHADIGDEHIIRPNPDDARDKAVLDKKRHRIEIWDGTLLGRIDDIITEIKNLGDAHTLIVCNHVASALHVYRKLKAKFGQQVMLLHSRFAARDRNHLEGELTDPNKSLPRMLVATQVVEVSLNIDFDQGFFEPAPIDATAQRLGRVNRAGSRPPARIVLMRSQISSHKLYDAERSARTVVALGEIREPISEDALVEIANEVYKDGYTTEQTADFTRAVSHDTLNRFEDTLIAGIHAQWADELFSEKDERMEVLPSSYQNEYDQLLKKGQWLEAMSCLVPLPAAMVIGMLKDPSRKQLIENRKDKPWIIRARYSGESGLQLDLTDTDDEG